MFLWYFIMFTKCDIWTYLCTNLLLWYAVKFSYKWCHFVSLLTKIVSCTKRATFGSHCLMQAVFIRLFLVWSFAYPWINFLFFIIKSLLYMATTVCFQSSSHIYLYSVDVHVYILVDLAADEDGSSGWFPTPSYILQADSTIKPWPISAQNKL